MLTTTVTQTTIPQIHCADVVDVDAVNLKLDLEVQVEPIRLERYVLFTCNQAIFSDIQTDALLYFSITFTSPC